MYEYGSNYIYGESQYKDEGVQFDFSGNPTSGSSPLSVQFIPEFNSSETETPVAYLWDFGDGVQSGSPAPLHTYLQAGTYTVSLTVWSGTTSSTVTKAGYITVTVDAALKLVSRCLRMATEETEGEGWSEYEGSDFVTPQDEGAYLIQDANDVTRCIVEDVDGMIYEQDTFDRINFLKPSFVDKAAIDGTGGVEISGAKWGCEETAGSGNENMRVLDQKNWIQIRPNDPDYRGLVGYTIAGLRDAQEIGLDVYVDGEKVTPSASTFDIPDNGEIVFIGNNVEGHRIQYVTNFSASEFKISEIKHEILVKDTTGTLSEKTMTEYNYQLAFETNKILHITRGKNPLYDRVSKKDAEAGGVGAISNPNPGPPLIWEAYTGPDGFTESALHISDYLNFPLQVAQSGQYTILFWAKENNVNFVNGNVEEVMLIYSPPTNLPATSWYLYYQILDYISANIQINRRHSLGGGPTHLFDMRMYSDAKTMQEIGDYYKNVVCNQGQSYLPGFL